MTQPEDAAEPADAAPDAHPDPRPTGDPDLPFENEVENEVEDRTATDPAAVRARRSVIRWASSLRPKRGDLRSDAVAGVSNAIASVPDGMAMALLVGVNPAYGLYASFAGKIGGGLFSSTALMVVTTTTAASLAAGSVLAEVPEPGRDGAIVALTLFTGILLVAVGLLRLGRYIRFVSRSVMVGFLTGISVNIIFGQLPGLLGVQPDPGVAVEKALYVISHLSEITVPSAVVGLGALAAMLVLGRTRLRLIATLIAVVATTAIVALAGIDVVRTVITIGSIPVGFPGLALPAWRDLFDVDLIAGAAAIAAIILVQGAGVAESAPNPDGSASSTNRDFIGQGAGSLLSGLFHGIPVGGSVSTTAINLAAGARSRWSAILGGVWMLVILVALARFVEMVPLPTLSAVLIYAALMTLKPAVVGVVWRTSTTGKIAMTVTFLSTLMLPIAAAVSVGVICSLVLQLNKEQMDFHLVRLLPVDGHFVERRVPRPLPDAEPVVLDVYGSLLYAGAKTLGARLPDPHAAHRPVVILRLRGRGSLGSTFFGVVADYADALHAQGGRLYLSGVDAAMVRRFEHSQLAEVRRRITVFPATEVIGESTLAALDDAARWLAETGPPPG
ncbi:SulP family inorganic anion transporter [Nakamurella sp.]|uniref:SulP family inorganic anion transporter n=1 Tax=Nakamurella sp. TaxID=1869182 RepID=UPI003784A7F8